MKLPSLLSLTIACIALAQPAQAEHYLTGYLGKFDVFDDGSALFGAEYRGNYVWHNLRPVGGAEVTEDEDIYGFAGIHYDLYLTDDIVVTPNFVAGLYNRHDGKKLGGPIEFRSGIEATYVLPNESRVGAAFNHISNASIYDKNPGAESVLFVYSHPLSGLFGGSE